MIQFPDDKNSRQIPVADGLLIYSPCFLVQSESDNFKSILQKEIVWKQEKIRIFGKTYLTPRLTSWIGDEGKTYCYSGLKLNPNPWTEVLHEMKTKIESATNHRFNTVLLNLYRNGNDCMGWHSDDEKELGGNPVIASLSLGDPRIFRFRNKLNHKNNFSLTLAHGSLLLMAGALQHHWQHCLPRTSKPKVERINLTFRTILP